MRFDDIMRDLDTGDASMHDVRVKEAEGKIAIASAYFEYASKLASESLGSRFVQEAAASNSDLPDDPAEGSSLASASVARELMAFYDVVVNNAKKVKSAAKRDLAAIIALGKNYGISTSAATEGNFMIAFAKPLAQALVRAYAGDRKKSASIKFAKGIFPAASDGEKLMFAYGNAMARLAAIYGLSIGDCIEDPTVREALSFDQNFLKYLKGAATSARGGDKYAANDEKAGFDQGGIENIDGLYKALMRGASIPKADKFKTVTKTDVDDIAELITYTYVVHQVSEGIVKAATSAKKAGAEKFVNQLIAAEEARGGKKVSAKMTRINENMKGWAEAVSATTDQIVKAFSDAVMALGKIAKGEGEGIVEYATDESYDSYTAQSFNDDSEDE